MRILCIVLLFQVWVFASDVEKWSITVYGSAQIEVDAELATIVYGVSEKGSSIDDAYQQLKATITKANHDLKRLGVNEQDIFVSNFTSGDNYWGNSVFFKADNFKASSRVTINNLKVTEVEAVILSLGKHGIDRILEVTYSLKSAAKYKEEARRMALLAAREKGQQMAGTLDGRIGDAIAIEEIPRAADVGYPVLAEKSFSGNPFNAMAAYNLAESPRGESFFPEIISIEEHVRVVFHLIQ